MDHRQLPSTHRTFGRTAALAGRSRAASVGLLLSALLLAAAGCDDATGPEGDRVRGILRFEPGTDVAASVQASSADASFPADATEGRIEAPDTVEVGETFTATVSTVGLDGCWQADGHGLTVEGLTATVVPFDVDRQRPGIACTQALKFLPHEVSLAFEEAGEATIRAEGRRVIGFDRSFVEPTALETTVTVVP